MMVSSATSSQQPSPESSGEFSSGFDGHLTPGARRAVIAVDFMRAHYDPSSPLCLPSDKCLTGAAAVPANTRAAGYPVFHTVVRFESGEQGGAFMRKVPALRLLISDIPGAVPPLGELMPEVAPLVGEPVLVKRGARAFFGTDLADRPREAEVNTVIIVGVSTSGCVRATAVEAVQHNFVPIVVRDAAGDRDDVCCRRSTTTCRRSTRKSPRPTTLLIELTESAF